MRKVERTITMYVADNGKEYGYPTDCMVAELILIQDKYRKRLECEPVRDFADLGRLIAFEPKLLAKLEELALLYGMEPRTKSEEGTNL